MKAIFSPFIALLILGILFLSSPVSGAQSERQIKGPWYGVFTHMGETNPLKTWKSFDSLKLQVSEIKKKNPHISGVTVKFLWKHINPAKNEYNFEGLDELLKTLEKNNMKVILSMFTGNQSAPDWIFQEGAKKFVASTKGKKGARKDVLTQPPYGPIPWDTKYMKFLEDCLRALASKINDDPRIFAVGVYGHNFVGGEMIMAFANSKKDLKKWDEMGRTDMVVFENWKHWVDLYARLFSKKKIVLTLGPMYAEGKRIGYLTDKLAQYAVDKYSDRVILQHMALHGRFDGLGICWERGDFDKCADSQIRNRDRVSSGFETLGSFVKQPDRQGNVEMTVFNALKANPLYIQLWPQDALHSRGPEIAQQIEELYKKSKNIKTECLREDLKKQGKYLQNYKWENKGNKSAISTDEEEASQSHSERPQRGNIMSELRSALSELDLNRVQKLKIKDIIENTRRGKESGSLSRADREKYIEQIREILTKKQRSEFDRLFPY
jgi:hypothetical protein